MKVRAVTRWFDASMFGALSVVWGLTFPAISVGLEFLPPLLFAALRYDVAAAVLLGYAAVRTDEWVPAGRNNQFAILGGGLFLIAGTGLLFIGQQTVPSGIAGIMQALMPIATAAWALFLLGEHLTVRGAIGVGIGFLGIALVVQPDPNNLLGGDTLGRLIIVGQVISVALGGVIIQRVVPSMDRVPLIGWSMLLGAIILHGLSLGVGELPGGGLTTPAAIGAILYLGVFATAIAYYIYFYIIEVHGAFQASLIAYLVPVVATIVGVFALGESINWLSYAGFGFVAAGFALLKRRALAAAIRDASIPGHR